MAKRSDQQGIDWAGVAVRFTCGAIAGLLVGFFLHAYWGGAPWVYFGAVLVCGTAAALWGDDFWHALGQSAWWW